ncbi:805_t:CDS:2 [Funneliformis mosseae]|uniref:805_t:CDS:1 n=1 Tax=Funneliformis mosseae TaxID=27381 RepID=A0A9N9CDQ9_FUNMO|nr:805_t:CDS:2 [Funneliformis mosseae]
MTDNRMENIPKPTYIDISSDGSLTATFNSESDILEIYDLNVNNTTPLNTIHVGMKNNLSGKIYYSLAISNYYTTSSQVDEKNAYVAVSSFCEPTPVRPPVGPPLRPSVMNGTDLENGIQENDNLEETFVFRILQEGQARKIETTVDRGGVVRFLNNVLSKNDDKSDGSMSLIVMNKFGITKVFINHNSPLIAEEYELPTTIQVKIENLYKENPCTKFLYNKVEKNFLFVEDYRNQRLELYNLQSLDLELICHKRDELSDLTQARGNSMFSISKNGLLLAYCNGTKSIAIHLMENGLEITTHEFTDANKILFISFTEDDEKLFIVTQIESSVYSENENITFTIKIYNWDLFTSKIIDVNDDQIINIFSSLQRDNNHSIACSSVLKLSDVKLIPTIKSQELLPILINQAQENSHTIFNLKGKRLEMLDAKKSALVVNNKEPWNHNKKLKRISSYLDENEKIQIIIGKTTVHVWKINGDEKKSKQDKRILEYIWVNKSNEEIKVASLNVGKEEFTLDLSWTVHEENKHHIHWPNVTHVLKDACVAMEYLYERRDEPVGMKLKHLTIYKDLVAGTESLIKKCIKENPDLWSLTEIRYDIMANIIRSKNTTLIHQILFDYKVTDDNKTRVSRYIHIPREKKWSMINNYSDEHSRERDSKIPSNEKSDSMLNNSSDDNCDPINDSDLILAIKNSSGGHRRDKVVVAMLLEYYSNNAEKDTGWMYTLTNALPLLSKRDFEPYLKELFYKSCFGSKEEHVDSRFVDENKLIDGYKSEICALNVRPRLLLKPNKLSWWNKFMTNTKDTKDGTIQVTLRVVPLPNFTVYPNETETTPAILKILLKFILLIFWPRGYAITKEKEYSIFLQLISKKEAFSFMFALVSGIIKDVDLVGQLMYGIFFYLGFYLLATEVVQFKHEKLKRYVSIYNLLDILSIMLAIATMVFTFVNGSSEAEEIIITQAFAVLFLWLELLMTIVAFGHAMHILLRNPSLFNEKPDDDTFNITLLNNENVIISQQLNVIKPFDNYYGKLVYSVMGVYFWIHGRWEHIEEWDFWPVYVISIGASILLVIIMQNLLIAFMTGVYEVARQNGKLAVLGYRADLIANYETVEKPMGSHRGNPKYIYYVGSSEYQEAWLDKANNYRSTHTSLLFEDVSSKVLSIDDNSDDDKLMKMQVNMKSLQVVTEKLISVEESIKLLALKLNEK